MWEKETMTLLESLVYSGMGLMVVMGVLACLALLIVIFSKILNVRTGTGSKQMAVLEHRKDSSEEETGAVIMSVICEEMGLKPEQIRITSIREI